jgi:hypothetical protein
MNSLGFVIACLTGWVNRHQQHVIEYLQEEVRVLKELHRGKRFTSVESARTSSATSSAWLGGPEMVPRDEQGK